MIGSSDEELKLKLKRIIIDECDKSVRPDAIADHDPLFGEESPVQLDSLDAIQLAMAIQKTFGIKVTDSKEVRRYFVNINSLAELVQPE